MGNTMRKAAVIASFGALCAVAALAACSSAGEKSFDSVDDLKEAFVDAGAACDDWQVGAQDGEWTEFGNCGVTGATLSIYEGSDDRDVMVEQMQSGRSLHSQALVGSNWIITTDADTAIAEELGADVVEL